jgi:filamentous hemagglutinin family protein
MKSKQLFLIVIIPVSTHAQITTDGSLGQALNLPGPDYQIGADLGQLRGGNLFHSFQDFNLQHFESATFSGPNHIQNVISRVTGGNPSSIDGLLRLTIPNADMYFINPYGIMFGPHARLDVQGSFHASTADYLRLKDGGRFDARNPSDSILTVAPIEAFGFFNAPAPIGVQGHGQVSTDWKNKLTGLRVPAGQTLSLIGGQIDIWMGTFFQDEENQINRLPILSAPHGRINLAAIASQGEVKLGGDFIDLSSFSQLAEIHIKENSLLETTGEGGGSIFIRGGQFFVDNSAIESKTLRNQDGGLIKLEIDTISLTNGAILDGSTQGIGQGSSIEVRATDSITIAGENADHTQESGIFARSGSFDEALDTALGDDLGNTGKIYLEAKNIVIKGGGAISTTTLSKGHAGKVTIKAYEMILVTGEGEKWEKIQGNWDGSYVASGTFSESENAGNAGQILIQAKNISFTDGSYIYSSTQGQGKGGQVTLKADETVSFSGKTNSSGYPARIYLDTQYQNNGAGHAGILSIDAKNISFQQGAHIDSTTIGKGQGGSITVNASDKITFTDSFVRGDTKGEGNAGLISIQANNIYLKKSYISSDTRGDGNANQVLLTAENIFIEGGWIASGAIGGPDNGGNADKVIIRAKELSISDANIYSESNNKKDAGQILIEVNNLLINNGGKLYTGTNGAGNAGNINIKATGRISLTGVNNNGFASGIESDSEPYAFVEDMVGGQGGDISIRAKELIIQDGGHISVSSIAKGIQSGPGGNITLQIEGAIKLSGVNPHGENKGGFGAGIYARSIGEKAGGGGQINLSAASLTLQEGAVIESSTNNAASSGNIEINVSGSIEISGDASQIELLAPAGSQKQYLQDLSPRTYNQSTSGIYANSNSSSELGGLGGNITLSAKSLIMTDNGRISTTSAGGGQAGMITIKVDQLRLDKTAKIASESQFTHTFDKETGQFVNSGDIIEIHDEGGGKIGTRMSLANKLIVIAPSIEIIANLAELDKISSQYHLIDGQVVEVKDIGNGQSARFIYTVFYDFSGEIENWFQIEEHNQVTLENREAYNEIDFSSEPPAYPAGTVIKVNNYEQGKSATFVYTTFFDLSNNTTLGQTTRIIEPLTVANVIELQQISDQTLLVEGTRATVLDHGTESHFIYYNDSWLKLGATHQVANVTELNELQFAQAGYIIDRNNQTPDLIYSGTQWLPLNSDKPRLVQNIAELDQLTAKTGDLVIVEDVRNGQYEHYFYAEGEWKKRQIQGGNAGQITIEADTLQLSGHSQISTSAITGGGGHVILDVDKMIYLTNSQISTSVQKEIGNGGNLTINGSPFVIMNNGKIIAQANEGHGGNIDIAAEQLIKSPDSLVSASSKSGIDGEVEINTPDENVTEGMLTLSYETVDVSRMMEKDCETMSYEEYENRSRFEVHQLAGSPFSPFDLQPSRLPQKPPKQFDQKNQTKKSRFINLAQSP